MQCELRVQVSRRFHINFRSRTTFCRGNRRTGQAGKTPFHTIKIDVMEFNDALRILVPTPETTSLTTWDLLVAVEAIPGGPSPAGH